MARLKSIWLVLLVSGMLQCSGRNDLDQPMPAAFDTGFTPAVQSFSLARAGGKLELVFADRSSLALVLARVLILPSADPPFSLGSVTFLDRISDMPGEDPLFGTHLLFSTGEDRHLLYLDRAADERLLLKHIHWTQDGANATIEALPFNGRPLAALPGDEGQLELYYEAGQQLCRQRLEPGAAVEPLGISISAEGEASMLSSERFQGFTAFDRLSQRLMLFRKNGRSLQRTEIARFGAVHCSALGDDGTVLALAYDQAKKRIVLFQEDSSGQGFKTFPVTLADEVPCLGMFSNYGMTFFLYSERVESLSRSASYRLSLLVPRGASFRRLSYRRQVLQEGSSPIPCFRAVTGEGELYVALQQGSIRFLRLDLKPYLRSESD